MDGMVKKWITIIVMVILVVTIVGSLAATVNNAADDITEDARCVDAACFWNSSRTSTGLYACTPNNVSINDQNNTCATAHTNTAFPMESLFNTGGIVILLFMAAAIVLTIGILTRKK